MENLIFSDKNRFSVDGSDGKNCFSGDKRIVRDKILKRVWNLGKVMVWAATS